MRRIVNSIVLPHMYCIRRMGNATFETGVIDIFNKLNCSTLFALYLEHEKCDV